ncbi:anti-sigma B factor RsbW [Thermosynechococcus sp. NK55a]|uniref:ATP-binding protein n=1 Tax=unclassified Thermosynechococcus TaxID=2622553 RepID=UPI0003D90149|nr:MULTISPECIES: ATP-binding protein [unclassified Thermosynechococcus]AHB89582.1 anti-sigma B factor RsbW [Thermosynechococcus sp. NK55a]
MTFPRVTVSLTLPSDLTQLEALLAWFNQYRPPTLPLEEWLKLELALAEGFTNAVRHAHRDRPPETPIRIDLCIAETHIELRIWDRGDPFDLGAKLQTLPPQISTDAEGGRGLRLLATIMDELAYQAIEEGGNCLILRKTVKPTPQ